MKEISSWPQKQFDEKATDRMATNESGMSQNAFDGALCRIGAVEPPAGFEQRLIANLANASSAESLQPRGWSLSSVFARRKGPVNARGPFSSYLNPRLATGMLAASLAGAAILVGSYIHSRPAPPISVQPTPHVRGGGFGPGTAVRQPAPGSGSGRPHAVNRGRTTGRPHHGRATLPSAPTHKAGGAVSPESPYPANAGEPGIR